MQTIRAATLALAGLVLSALPGHTDTVMIDANGTLLPLRGEQSVPDVLATTEVWVAVRSDGVAGTGTRANPHDGSTRARFDGVMTGFGPNTVINLGPGTFFTKGAADNGGGGYFVKEGWKIRGAGRHLTRVKLSALPTVDGRTAIFTVAEQSGRADNVEVSDMTLDCNWTALGGPTTKALAGVVLQGSNCRIERVRVTEPSGWLGANVECFPISIWAPATGDAVNAVIDDCQVDNPHGDYVAAITTGGNANFTPERFMRGAIVSNCLVQDNGWFAYGAGVAKNVTFANNKAENCLFGYRTDTGNTESVLVVGNQFLNTKGHGVHLTPQGAITFKDMAFRDNLIELNPADLSENNHAFFLLQGAGGSTGSGLSIENNTLISRSASAYTYSISVDAGWTGVKFTLNTEIAPLPLLRAGSDNSGYPWPERRVQNSARPTTPARNEQQTKGDR